MAGKNSNGAPPSAQENNELFMSELVAGQRNALAKIPAATAAPSPFLRWYRSRTLKQV